MTETKHTPGPWQIGQLESYEGGTGIAFRRVYFTPTLSEIQEAHVRGDKCDANAHLIAAAPDLLEALDDSLALLLLHTGPDDDIANLVINKGRAALAKAKGDPS